MLDNIRQNLSALDPEALRSSGMMTALSILANNRPRPLSQGPNTLGSALGQGGLMGMQAYKNLTEPEVEYIRGADGAIYAGTNTGELKTLVPGAAKKPNWETRTAHLPDGGSTVMRVNKNGDEVQVYNNKTMQWDRWDPVKAGLVKPAAEGKAVVRNMLIPKGDGTAARQMVRIDSKGRVSDINTGEAIRVPPGAQIIGLNFSDPNALPDTAQARAAKIIGAKNAMYVTAGRIAEILKEQPDASTLAGKVGRLYNNLRTNIVSLANVYGFDGELDPLLSGELKDTSFGKLKAAGIANVEMRRLFTSLAFQAGAVVAAQAGRGVSNEDVIRFLNMVGADDASPANIGRAINNVMDQAEQMAKDAAAKRPEPVPRPTFPTYESPPTPTPSPSSAPQAAITRELSKSDEDKVRAAVESLAKKTGESAAKVWARINAPENAAKRQEFIRAVLGAQ